MMKNLIRFFLIGISLVTLLYAAQTSLFKGVQNVQAVQGCTEVDSYSECTGCNTSQTVSKDSCGGFTVVSTQSDSACASWCPPPPPTCTEKRQYNECISCNTSRRVAEDTCGNFSVVVPSQPDAACTDGCTPPPPPPGCVPDGSCNAAAPACGTTTTGVNNCNQACTKVGADCPPPPICVPNNSCTAPEPACGTTTTGVNNCGGACTKTGAACIIGCTPNGSCSAVMPSACGSINTGKDNCDNVCFRQSAACSTGGVNVTQTQTQNNNQSVNVTQQVSGNVGLGSGAQVLGVKELPKTGLPELAWSALAFVPAGFGLRKFRSLKKDLTNNPNFIWEDRQFKS